MKRLRIISSISFLLMFAVISLHNLVPHIHHAHEADSTHHHSHDDHGHHHHDHDADSDERSFDDFLILLFAHHSHDNESFDGDVELNQDNSLKNSKEVALAADSDLFEATIDVKDNSYYLFRHRVHKSESFLSKPLRGPPAVG